jgi:hypothetical protein
MFRTDYQVLAGAVELDRRRRDSLHRGLASSVQAQALLRLVWMGCQTEIQDSRVLRLAQASALDRHP